MMLRSRWSTLAVLAGVATFSFAQAPTQLPSLPVVGHAVPGENKIIGAYGQPEWSARRPFPGVSVYVQPAGQAEFEFSFSDALQPEGAHEREWAPEVEIGLPHRFQLAIEEDYANFREGSPALQWHQGGIRAAVRYALADWGKIPLNPAVGVGRRFRSAASDAAIGEFALGDELAPRWHWGANASYERQAGHPSWHTLSTAAALTYSVTNETLNIGLQGEWRQARKAADAISLVRRTTAGPCLQYRPIDRIHLDVATLFGTEHGRAVHDVRLSFGFEFGEGSDDHDDDERRPGGRFGH